MTGACACALDRTNIATTIVSIQRVSGEVCGTGAGPLNVCVRLRDSPNSVTRRDGVISGSSVAIRPCPACDDPSPHLLVELSKDSAVDYYRCQNCRHVWTTSKETGEIVRHVTPSPPRN